MAAPRDSRGIRPLRPMERNLAGQEHRLVLALLLLLVTLMACPWPCHASHDHSSDVLLGQQLLDEEDGKAMGPHQILTTTAHRISLQEDLSSQGFLLHTI